APLPERLTVDPGLRRDDISGNANFMSSEVQRTGGEIILLHSSDLHVDDERIEALHQGDGSGVLRDVLATARSVGADIVLLAGDTFDNHQVTSATIDRAGVLLADTG